MTPEARVLAALDQLRDAFGDLLAARAEPAEPAELMTISAAAARLGVSRSTATRWADTGRLRTVGGLGSRRVPASALAALTTSGAGGAVEYSSVDRGRRAGTSRLARRPATVR